MKTKEGPKNKKTTGFRFFYRLKGKPRAAKHYHRDSHCQVSTDPTRAKTYECSGGTEEQLAIIRQNFEYQFARSPHLYEHIEEWLGKSVSDIEVCCERLPRGTPARRNSPLVLVRIA